MALSGHPVQGGSPLHPELPGEPLATLSPELGSMSWKIILLVLVFLKHTHSHIDFSV